MQPDKIKIPVPAAEQDTGLDSGVADRVSLETETKNISFKNNSVSVQPNPEATIAFLDKVFPGRSVTITKLLSDPNKRPADWPRNAGITFTRTFANKQRITEWVVNAARDEVGLYYTLNGLEGSHNKKPQKEDIKTVGWLHCDCDPRVGEDVAEEQKRILEEIRKYPIPPTAVKFSGGGYQCLWKLETEITITCRADILEVEERNRWLGSQFISADNTQNIDRILRLPGSINFPNEKKRKKGQVPAVACVVEELTDWSRVYRLDDVPRLSSSDVQTKAAHTLEGLVPQKLESLDKLDQWSVPKKLREIITTGKAEHHPSRSEAVLAVACGLTRCSVPAAVIMGILLNPHFAISDSVLERGGNAEEYARQQVEKAAELTAQKTSAFKCNQNGSPDKNSQHNIRTALCLLGVKVRFDKFNDRLLIEGLEGFGPLLNDDAMTRLWLTIDEHYHFRPGKDFFWSVVTDAARQNSCHPVLDYLDDLSWDGIPRVDGWLSQYGGAENTPYTRAVGALMLVGLMRRVRSPGCKFDEMVVLEGDQGTNKSSALAVLAVREEWFTDDMPLNAEGKRVIESLAGRLIVEAAELKGMKRGEVEGLKAFLSRQVDRARMSYDRLISEVPRQCIIVGTTNSSHYLRDGTGNRRFWPVKIDCFDLEALRRDRDQLWAEAAHREEQGEAIRLAPELWQFAAAEQEKRAVEDPYLMTLREVLGDMRGKITAADVFDIIGIPSGQRMQEHNSRIGEAMRHLGWERKKLRFGGQNPEWAYVRGNDEERSRRIVVHTMPGSKPQATQEGAIKEPF